MLDGAAELSNIVRNVKSWMNMFDPYKTFSSNILRYEDCCPLSEAVFDIWPPRDSDYGIIIFVSSFVFLYAVPDLEPTSSPAAWSTARATQGPTNNKACSLF